MALRFPAPPPPRSVAYSDLVAALDASGGAGGGHDVGVTAAKFEEGSNLVYFNAELRPGQQPLAGAAEAPAAIAALLRRAAEQAEAAPAALPKRPSPKWQFDTRTVRGDEGNLLALMRRGKIQ
eukprot:SM000016S01914  [mRNA]  locus=s16:579206:579727:+ [translate_table: standard]